MGLRLRRGRGYPWLMEGRLLVVEDDPQVRAMLTRALRYEGFEVAAASDGAEAMAALRSSRPDLLLLDLLLPDADGVELCGRLRDEGDIVPILMLTARDTVSDRVAGFEAGADDYLVKPFSTAELVARVRALLRRARDRPAPTTRRVGDLELDATTHEVRRGGRTLRLTRREFDLLALFLDHPGTVLARGWSMGLSSPCRARKPWLVVPAAEDGGSADADDISTRANRVRDSAMTAAIADLDGRKVLMSPGSHQRAGWIS